MQTPFTRLLVAVLQNTEYAITFPQIIIIFCLSKNQNSTISEAIENMKIGSLKILLLLGTILVGNVFASSNDNSYEIIQLPEGLSTVCFFFPLNTIEFLYLPLYLSLHAVVVPTYIFFCFSSDILDSSKVKKATATKARP